MAGILAAELGGAIADIGQGRSAMGADGNFAQPEVSGNLGLSAISPYTSGGPAGSLYGSIYAPETSANATHENTNSPIDVFRFLTADQAHCIAGMDELSFIKRPSQSARAMKAPLASVLEAAGTGYAKTANPRQQGTLLSDNVDMASQVGQNICALNEYLYKKQEELLLNDIETFASLTPEMIWHGSDKPGLEWTGWTLDGTGRLEEMALQKASHTNDGYGIYTPYKKNGFAGNTPRPQKMLTTVRAGRSRMKDIFRSRGLFTGAITSLILTTKQVFDEHDTVEFITTTKSETSASAGASRVFSAYPRPKIEDLRNRAHTPAAKTERAKALYASLKSVPAYFQLFAVATRDEPGLRFTRYTDPWGMPHFDGLVLSFGVVQNPPYGPDSAEEIRSPDDFAFLPVINGEDIMLRPLIEDVLLRPDKDGHMALI
jgi:hypothetical protein